MSEHAANLTVVATTGTPLLPAPPSAAAAAAAAAREDAVPLWSRLKLEALVLGLLLLTFAAFQFEDLFTSRTLQITPTNRGVYAPYFYGDQASGGDSTVESDDARPLQWTCTLRPKYAYPFCGYGMLFDQTEVGRGLDLSKFQTVTVRLSYRGPGDKVQLSLVNTDPRYAAKTSGPKPNQLQVPIAQGRQTVTFDLSALTVAEWWTASHDLPEAFERVQVDNVTGLEIQPGAGAPLGRHRYAVESITFEGRWISDAQYQLALLAAWALIIGGFLLYRFREVRRRFERRHHRQLREQQALAEAKSVAESASAAKSAFLANMSHELRTPLNAILGYAQLLEREMKDDRQALAARTIRQSGTHLLTLITDILDLSKIEAGRLELQPTAFHLRGCIHGIANMMRIRAEEKGLAFVCALDDQLPDTVVGDEKRLRQVLINLLGNAIKFTQAGEVRFSLSHRTLPDGRAGMRVEVRDTGVGMKAEHLPRIFETFEQVGDADSQAGGTGLGLSISRRIVELMEGRIEVESSEGRGSCFAFDIPLEIAANAAARLGDRTVTGYAGPRRRILLIDDDVAGRMLLLGRLAELGFNVEIAADGLAGVSLALETRPDLVLTRLKLPGICGLELIRRLRAERGSDAPPVVALSARPDEATLRRVRDAGAAALVPLPVPMESLLQMLREQLDLQWTNGPTLEGEVQPIASVTSDLVPPPQEQLEQLLDLARAGNMRAIRQFADGLAADRRYRPYAERVKALAAAYQSPAILDLVSQHLTARQAA